MKVLLDENVDRRVRRFFDAEHEVMTVVEQGWSGITNGELLSRAEQQFDVLITMDQNLQYQQNVQDRDLAVIVVQARSNRPSDVEPVMGQVNEALQHANPGSVIEVAA
jgi:predicted nuclease of predicted toxin-antitoxin system